MRLSASIRASCFCEIWLRGQNDISGPYLVRRSAKLSGRYLKTAAQRKPFLHKAPQAERRLFTSLMYVHLQTLRLHFSFCSCFLFDEYLYEK